MVQVKLPKQFYEKQRQRQAQEAERRKAAIAEAAAEQVRPVHRSPSEALSHQRLVQMAVRHVSLADEALLRPGILGATSSRGSSRAGGLGSAQGVEFMQNSFSANTCWWPSLRALCCQYLSR